MSSLGRIIRHDPRSKGFRTRHAGAPIIFANHKRLGKPFDQGELGSCTGNAGGGCLNTEPLYNGTLATEADAVTIYSAATKLDSFLGVYPPNDTGSSGLAVAQVLKRMGRISRYEHAFSLNDVLASLGRGPGMLGIAWYSSFDSPVGPKAELKLTASAVARGGHEIELTGVDPKTKLVTGWNSWGSEWGNKGTFTISFSTLERLLKEHGDYVIPIK